MRKKKEEEIVRGTKRKSRYLNLSSWGRIQVTLRREGGVICSAVFGEKRGGRGQESTKGKDATNGLVRQSGEKLSGRHILVSQRKRSGQAWVVT